MPGEACGICLEALERDLWRCHKCCQRVHSKCFARWRRQSCPFCRHDHATKVDTCHALAFIVACNAAMWALYVWVR